MGAYMDRAADAASIVRSHKTAKRREVAGLNPLTSWLGDAWLP